LCTVIFFSIVSDSFAADPGSAKKNDPGNLRQYYSGKFGFYQPGDGLNNGLILGVDGITEFVHYSFFLSGAIDLYPKQTIDIFQQPKPDVSQQQVLLIPLHVNFGYKLFDVTDADTRGYVGVGGGYYFYFYSVSYSSSGGGGLLGPLPGTSQSDSKNGGGLFATAFARVLIGQIFLEPRFYFASKKQNSVGSYSFTINPSGFAITLGFQYH
ncbi:MAG: hypothetical protein KGJ59_06105, partial [Bacteroidota bacterium]|nr:hypothetical protein [Bacteroidota bacterium]